MLLREHEKEERGTHVVGRAKLGLKACRLSNSFESGCAFARVLHL